MMMNFTGGARRGTVLTLALIVSIVITAIVAALSWSAGNQAKATGDFSKIDQAFFAAETGAQRVAWYLKKNPDSYHDASGNLTSPFNAAFSGSVNGYTYSTTCATVSSTDMRLLVTSTGSNGKVSYTLSMYMTPPAQGLPTFATGGDWNNKNMTVVGDVQTAGVFTAGGSDSLTGNLYYGSLSSTGTSVATGVARYVNPSDPTDPNAFKALAWTAASGTPDVQDTLNAVVTAEGSSATYTGDQNGTTFDFTKLTGTTTPVYKVVGNVTDPNIVGSGTLFVVGSITFTKNISLGTSSNPVNLVSMGAVNNITFDKKATIYGSLYAQGDWDRAQTDVYGMVYVQGVMDSNSGSSTLNATGITVPFFDTRAPAGSQVTSPLSVSHFSGPQP